ncbi:TonB-dependent receptor [Novosphingobium terrae]|uniref:TonB-dependent receptor n=1 Tax=Novosphingobium terrae TaxID=2726189 RepID=UPI00197FEF79|nr:TonB-dependent receptor [Novosphingobium terrae]
MTATRRSESAQKTPVTLTPISGQALQQAGINGVTDLTGAVPSLTVDHNGMIFLRGIGSTDTREEGDPTVAAYMDGVYLAPYWSERALGFFDIDRVEVLAGPQGTLFGRNSTAGAINTITKAPQLGVTGGDLSVSGGNYNALQTTGAVNIPLGDKLAVRLAFQTDNHDNYNPSRENPSVGLNNADTKAVRLSVKWAPTDRLTVVLRGDYEKDNSVPGNFGTGYTTNGHPTDFKSDIAFTPSNNSHYSGVSLQADWSVGPGKLTALASNRQSDFKYITAYQILNSTPFKQYINGNVQQYELRYAGDVGRLKYLVGLFYFHENLNPVDASFPSVFTFSTPANAGLNSYEFIEKESSKAAYGQLTYAVTDRLRLTGGLRYSDDNKFRTGQGGEIFFPAGAYTVNNGIFPANPIIYTGPYSGTPVAGIPNYANITAKKTDWKAGLEYDVARDSMIYANISTGFKDGGYNDAITPNQNQTYAPEKIIEYEIGSKNQFFDHRLQVNADVFFYNYTQLQVTGVQDIPNAAPQAITFNSGRATSLGADLSIIAKPTRRDRIEASIGWLHAKYVNFYLPLGDAYHTGPADYSGNPLQAAAPYTLSFVYSHDFDVAQGKITPRVNVHVVGHQSMNYTDFAIAQQSAYSRTDLSLTYSPNGAKWWLQAYVRNLENRVVYSYVQPNSPTAAGYSLQDPRTYGATLHYSF